MKLCDANGNDNDNTLIFCLLWEIKSILVFQHLNFPNDCCKSFNFVNSVESEELNHFNKTARIGLNWLQELFRE